MPKNRRGRIEMTFRFKLHVIILLLCCSLLITTSTYPQNSGKLETKFEELSALEQVLERYIQAVGGRTAIGKLTTRICKGKLIHNLHWRNPPYEVVPFNAYAKTPDKLVVIEHKSKGTYREGCDGNTSWKQDTDGIKQIEGVKRSKFAWLIAPKNALRLKDYFPDLKLKGRESLEGREVYVVEPTELDKTYFALYFDVETGLLIRLGYYWELQDYREVDGVKLPFRISMTRKGGASTYVFDEVKHNAPIDDALFAVPDLRIVFIDALMRFKKLMMSIFGWN